MLVTDTSTAQVVVLLEGTLLRGHGEIRLLGPYAQGQEPHTSQGNARQCAPPRRRAVGVSARYRPLCAFYRHVLRLSPRAASSGGERLEYSCLVKIVIENHRTE
jgi:hypothetical protein